MNEFLMRSSAHSQVGNHQGLCAVHANQIDQPPAHFIQACRQLYMLNAAKADQYLALYAISMIDRRTNDACFDHAS